MATPMSSVTLRPSAGFCVKSSTLAPGVLPPTAPPPPQILESNGPTATKSASAGGLLEPTASAQPTVIAQGMKVFVNIAYDANVPPPPEGSEEEIKRAMNGEVGAVVGEGSNGGWYVPVIVSQPRVDKDKAGNPSLVIDAVYNSQVKTRTLTDPEFKIFLVELGLQRIEAQTSLPLSRSIKFPNIASKGKLQPRTVRIPTVLLPAASAKKLGEGAITGPDGNPYSGKVLESVAVKKSEGDKMKKRPLIEPLPDKEGTAASQVGSGNGLKGILKKPASETSKPAPRQSGSVTDWSWSWEKAGKDAPIAVKLKVPGLTSSSIRAGRTALDVEPRRIILTIGPEETIVIDRTKSDAQIVADGYARTHARNASSDGMEEIDEEVTAMLALKRERAFDVEGARSEWREREEELVVFC